MIAALAGAVTSLAACGERLRTVPIGSHPTSGVDPILVEFPPPPARPELVTPDPGAPCRWLDGHWTWAGRRWHWVPGAWVVPPPNCVYARARIAWYAPPERGAPSPLLGEPPGAGAGPDAGARTDSRLYYTVPRWYPADASTKTCREPNPCGVKVARPSSG